MMALSETQLCLLNNIMYNDTIFKVITTEATKGDPKTLGEIINSFNSADETYYTELTTALHTSRQDWADIFAAVQRDSDLRQLRVYDVDTNTYLGSRNACFLDKSGNPYVIFKGTGKNETGSEWGDNAEGLGVSDTPQQLEARAYVDYIYNRTHKEITVSGHSKGGNKAMYCAVTSDHVSSCVSFDGQGFSAGFLDRYGPRVKARASRITNYRAEGDFVSVLLNSIGTHVSIQSTRLGDDYAKNHTLVAMLDDDMKLGKRGMRSPAATQIHLFTVWLDSHASARDRETIGRYLGRILNALVGTKTEGIADIINDDPESFSVILAYLTEYGGTTELIESILIEFFETGLTSDKGTLFDQALFFVTNKTADRLVRDMLMTIALTLFSMSQVAPGLFGSALKGLLERLRSLLNRFGISDEAIETINTSTKTHREAIRSGATRKDAASAVGSTLVHDFSDEKLAQLVGLIREINNEPWYDISRWDVWYRAEQWFGRLRIENYRHDMSSYYRKTLDIQGTSEQEVRRLFGKAHTLDGSLSARIQAMRSTLAACRQRLSSHTYGI